MSTSYAKPFQVPSTAHYLFVPYDYKEEAKQLGAWYDATKKQWYCTKNHLSKDVLIQMFGDKHETELRAYVHINPDQEITDWDEYKEFIAQVKCHGAKYDKLKKLFFFYRNNPNLAMFEDYVLD